MTTEDGEFWDLVKDVKIGMFTAFSREGHLRSRPMTTQNREDDRHDKLWFFMSRDRAPVLDLMRNPNVNVSYADPGSDAYISVAGRASLFDDIQMKKDFWSTAAQAWFPGGAEDPEVALIAVAIEHVDYWKVERSKMVHIQHHDMRMT